jgi:hypothetical protein
MLLLTCLLLSSLALLASLLLSSLSLLLLASLLLSSLLLMAFLLLSSLLLLTSLLQWLLHCMLSLAHYFASVSPAGVPVVEGIPAVCYYYPAVRWRKHPSLIAHNRSIVLWLTDSKFFLFSIRISNIGLTTS